MGSSEDLAQEVRSLFDECEARILGARSEYEHEGDNRFYNEGLADQLTGLEEELLDCMNWAAMSLIKIRNLRNEVQCP